MGLEHLSSHYPAELSGGEMQRVAIARALINRPRILLVDEPTGSLDSVNAEAIMTLSRSLNAEGLTILLVTHNLELTSQAARVIRLRVGRVVGDEHKLRLSELGDCHA